MFAAEGLSYKAIARRLNIRPRTVGTRLLRARAQLRADLSVRGRRRACLPLPFTVTLPRP